MCNFVRDLRAWTRDLSIYLLTTGVIPRRRTAIKPRRAEFTVMGVWRSPLFPSNLYSLLKAQHARVFFPPEKSSLSHFDSVSGLFSSLFPTRVLRGFTVRGMGSWILWSMGLWLNPLYWTGPCCLWYAAHTCTRIQTWLFTRSLFISSFVFSFGSSRESLTVCLPFETRWFIATHAEHSTTPPSRVDGDSSDSCGHVGTKLSLRYSRLSGEMLVEDVWRGLMAA